jgi:hypothetical protein
MTILIVVIGIFGITFVGVLIDDILFGNKRTKQRLEELRYNILKGRIR